MMYDKTRTLVESVSIFVLVIYREVVTVDKVGVKSQNVTVCREFVNGIVNIGLRAWKTLKHLYESKISVEILCGAMWPGATSSLLFGDGGV